MSITENTFFNERTLLFLVESVLLLTPCLWHLKSQMTFKDTSHALKLCFGVWLRLSRVSALVLVFCGQVACHSRAIFLCYIETIFHVGLLGDWTISLSKPCSSTTRLPYNTPLFTVRLGLLLLKSNETHKIIVRHSLFGIRNVKRLYSANEHGLWLIFLCCVLICEFRKPKGITPKLLLMQFASLFLCF